ncbi:MAG: hypothetical protein GEV04_15815 [Actinophytocola sp.]|nr:hypothetical protein [Actinophytocola sp.]
MRRVTAALAAGVLLTLFTAAAPGMAHEQDAPRDGAAAELLENFEHIYNFGTGESADAEGTDLDFWTAEVPLRDYATGDFVDEEGNPLPTEDADGNPIEAEPILAERDFAVAGSWSVGARIFDITDPDEPRFVSEVECEQVRNDPAVKQFTDADGNSLWLLALAKDDFGGPICLRQPRIGDNHNAGITVYDVTDPYEWSAMYSVQFEGGAHNFTFHPTQPFGWAATGDLPGALGPPLGFNWVPIIDFRDPNAPTISRIDVPAGGPHDLEFSADGTRAYVAAENHYEIYDTTDPANPTLIGGTPNIGSYAHGVFPTPDKSMMITNNESLVLGGFFVEGSGVCPGEGLAFYDIEGAAESAPVLHGYYAPQQVEPLTGPCTSHFGKVADNNHVITIGWYTLGSRVVDFANRTLPQEVGAAVLEGSNAWSAKFYQGPYLYVGDINRGFDVFKWTGEGPAPWENTTS